MRITRRQFIKYCTVAAGALGLSASALFKLKQVMAKAGGLPVNWIAGQACTGCTTSLANAIQILSLQDALLLAPLGTDNTVHIHVMETLMGAEGDNAIAQVYTSSSFVLAVEGSIPATSAGHPRVGYCTIGDYSALGVSGPDADVGDVVSALGNHADCIAILAIGQCASYGGVPGASGNVTGAMGVLDYLPELKEKTICLPGCPPNPEWMMGAIVDILLNNALTLDNTNRPSKYYPRRLCNSCYRYPQAGTNHFINPLLGDQLGDPSKNHCDGTAVPTYSVNHWVSPDTSAYCLRRVGCRGQRIQSNCGTLKWNSPGPEGGLTGPYVPGVNWCVGAGAGCQGCVQKGFPDAFSPFWTLK